MCNVQNELIAVSVDYCVVRMGALCVKRNLTSLISAQRQSCAWFTGNNINA